MAFFVFLWRGEGGGLPLDGTELAVAFSTKCGKGRPSLSRLLLPKWGRVAIGMCRLLTVEPVR